MVEPNGLSDFGRGSFHKYSCESILQEFCGMLCCTCFVPSHYVVVVVLRPR